MIKGLPRLTIKRIQQIQNPENQQIRKIPVQTVTEKIIEEINNELAA